MCYTGKIERAEALPYHQFTVPAFPFQRVCDPPLLYMRCCWNFSPYTSVAETKRRLLLFFSEWKELWLLFAEPHIAAGVSLKQRALRRPPPSNCLFFSLRRTLIKPPARHFKGQVFTKSEGNARPIRHADCTQRCRLTRRDPKAVPVYTPCCCLLRASRHCRCCSGGPGAAASGCRRSSWKR